MVVKINDLKNCYGINSRDGKDRGIKNYSFDFSKSNKHINVIYGVNRSGKTSITKVFKNMLDKKNHIINLFEDDPKPYVDIELFGENIIYDGVWKYKNNLSNRLFICDKSFLNSSITVIQEKAYIGVNAESYYRKKEELKNAPIPANEIKKFVKEITKIDKKNELKGFSQNTVLLDYYSTKDKPFNTLLQKYEEKTKHKDFNAILVNDLMGLLTIDEIDFKPVTSYIEELSNKLYEVKSKYHIKTVDDCEFYFQSLKYLKHKDHDQCPICLKEFDAEELQNIIRDIRKSVEDFDRDSKTKGINNIITSTRNINSSKVKLLNEYLEKLLNNDFSIVDRLKKLMEDVEYFYENVEDYINSRVINNFTNKLDKYKNLKEEVKISYDSNSSVVNSKLVEVFNKLIKDSELELSFKTKGVLNKESNYIELKIEKSKSDINVAEYQEKHSSEGEKSILSILFFFAYVETLETKEKPLIIIDDPIDSHDNYNKKLILHFIFSMIDNKKIKYNTILLTHSSDVVRDIKLNYKYCTNYHMISNESNNIIFPIKEDDLVIFDGVIPFFKAAIKKMKNKPTDSVFTAVAMLPILRDVIENTRILNDPLIKKDEINDLYEKISDEALHYCPDKSKEMSTKELIQLYEDIIPNFVHTNLGEKTLKKYPDEKISNYLTRCYRAKKYKIDNITENIKLKNVCAMKLRNSMEEIIYHFMQKVFDSSELLDKEKFEKEYSDEHTVQEKLSYINKNYYQKMNKNHKKEWEKIKTTIQKYKPIANDFHHMVNSYITPMLEMPLEQLRLMIRKIEDINKKLESNIKG
jgi:hypothetical protein